MELTPAEAEALAALTAAGAAGVMDVTVTEVEPELEPCGYPAAECAAWRDALLAEADAEPEPELEADWEREWDGADSAAYHARVEAGLEPEAGQ